jgi:diketogulonate reductase-like aldo/keto reductase
VSAGESTASGVARTTLPLNTGGLIPQVGLGVWQIRRGGPAREAVLAALRSGYRHVDTARIYGNERDVGDAIRQCEIAREEIFVTTKLWNDDQGYEKAMRGLDASLAQLGLDYVDLYLVHWPVYGKRKDSWRALERLFRDKKARAIGVSNYLVPHLRELLAEAGVVPAVNQIELSPFLQRRETVKMCQEKGIVVEAYSPLTRGARLRHPAVVRVAERVGKSPAQVLLRWGVQHGLVVLPKSSNEARIAENGDLFGFTLDSASMAELDALEEGLVTGWDPSDQK